MAKPLPELKVIEDFYDFSLWLLQHTEKFPRQHRYSLGIAMENRLQSILALLLKAKYRREKRELLAEANIELEIMRFQVRLAKDLRAFPIKSHGHAAGLMLDLGAQIGGWLRSRSDGSPDGARS